MTGNILEIADAFSHQIKNIQGDFFRLYLEAKRIKLCYLFDYYSSVHNSLIEPLPHQIIAVYDIMLQLQPLRFLLADDPGAGKTIMAGLLIKELIIRGEIEHCLIVAPGSLVDQWKDELNQKFHLNFEIFSRENISGTNNNHWLDNNTLIIARLDTLSRNEDLQKELRKIDWDLIIVDEAHKMSSHYFGKKLNRTKRYKLGELLSQITRNYLLLTATPHNGFEEDFQLFLRLIDPDRFEGKFRDGIHIANNSDIMRRLTKEQILKFDGTPLFPIRYAYTIKYSLSSIEKDLYESVTKYVREEFNRAERIENVGRRRTIGFALTILQRRLASSPEAIYSSLKRRRGRLEETLNQIIVKNSQVELELFNKYSIDQYYVEQLDEGNNSPIIEIEAIEDEIVDFVSAATSKSGLQKEIEILSDLEIKAYEIMLSGVDKKWEELSTILVGNSEMFDPFGKRRKLIIFTEHRDTLFYLKNKIETLLGSIKNVVTIFGSMSQEQRKKSQYLFTTDEDVYILIATDAAGEGFNLQSSHLMVNYDLPWNPNRIEQRFGRIHRIGQTNNCHLWNFVAHETREGQVWNRLFEKLEEERKSLGDKVFDILGDINFGEISFREILLKAILDDQSSKDDDIIFNLIDHSIENEKSRRLLQDNALANDVINMKLISDLQEKYTLNNHDKFHHFFISSFFIHSYELLGGIIEECPDKYFHLKKIPHIFNLMKNKQEIFQLLENCNQGIIFQKELVILPDYANDQLIQIGHPLLNQLIDLIIGYFDSQKNQPFFLIDDLNQFNDITLLMVFEDNIAENNTQTLNNRILSKKIHYILINKLLEISSVNETYHLNLRSPNPNEIEMFKQLLDFTSIYDSMKAVCLNYLTENLIPLHFNEIKKQHEDRIHYRINVIQDRLNKEIEYLNFQEKLMKAKIDTGTPDLKDKYEKTQRIKQNLEKRLHMRINELQSLLPIKSMPPRCIGETWIIPKNYFKEKNHQENQIHDNKYPSNYFNDEILYRIIEVENKKGRVTRNVRSLFQGYDIESKNRDSGEINFLLIKKIDPNTKCVLISRIELMAALNAPSQYILVIIDDSGGNESIRYYKNFYSKTPEFKLSSLELSLLELKEFEVIY